VKWFCVHLCVILDIGRRRVGGGRVAGWRIGLAGSAAQIEALSCDAMARHAVPPDRPCPPDSA